MSRALPDRTGWLMAPALLMLGLVFLVPLAWFFIKTLLIDSTPAALPGLFTQVLTSRPMRIAMVTTLWISTLVTAVTLVIGYPIAFYLANRRGWRFSLVIFCVVVPYFTSVIVRTYSWMVILGRDGIINQLLMGSGLIKAPLTLLYNPFGIVVGMTYVLLPFMVLTLYATMKGIDPSLIRAARALGASPLYVFRRVYFPLSLDGVVSGALIVLILAIGFFITPALMGGPSDVTVAMLIERSIEIMIDWQTAAVIVPGPARHDSGALCALQPRSRRATPARSLRDALRAAGFRAPHLPGPDPADRHRAGARLQRRHFPQVPARQLLAALVRGLPRRPALARCARLESRDRHRRLSRCHRNRVHGRLCALTGPLRRQAGHPLGRAPANHRTDDHHLDRDVLRVGPPSPDRERRVGRHLPCRHRAAGRAADSALHPPIGRCPARARGSEPRLQPLAHDAHRRHPACPAGHRLGRALRLPGFVRRTRPIPLPDGCRDADPPSAHLEQPPSRGGADHRGGQRLSHRGNGTGAHPRRKRYADPERWHADGQPSRLLARRVRPPHRARP